MNWNNWMDQVIDLYNKAIDEVDENYMKQNFESKIAETRLLLEMHHLIEPLEYTIIFKE